MFSLLNFFYVCSHDQFYSISVSRIKRILTSQYIFLFSSQFFFLSLLWFASIFHLFSVILLRLRILMNVTQIYATVANDFFFVFIIVNLLSRTVQFRKKISLLTFKHLTYLYFLNHHQLLSSWSWIDVLIQLIYIMINVFCLSFWVFKISKADLQAENLSLVNMISLFADAHLSFLTDLLEFSLNSYRRVQRSTRLMTFALNLFHVLVVVINWITFSLKVSEHLFELIVNLCCYFHCRL